MRGIGGAGEGSPLCNIANPSLILNFKINFKKENKREKGLDSGRKGWFTF